MCPSPLNPALHVQLKEPGVFVQIASSWQASESEHSSISANQNPPHLARQKISYIFQKFALTFKLFFHNLLFNTVTNFIVSIFVDPLNVKVAYVIKYIVYVRVKMHTKRNLLLQDHKVNFSVD